VITIRARQELVKQDQGELLVVSAHEVKEGSVLASIFKGENSKVTVFFYLLSSRFTLI